MNTIKCELKEMNKNINLLKFFDEESPFMNPNKPYIPPPTKIKEKDNNGKDKKNSDDKNNEDNHNIDEEINLDIIDNKYKKEIIDDKINPENYDLTTDSNSELIQKYFLILGDMLGNIKMLDLMGLIKKYKINIPQKAYIKSSFNILKKDDVNAETILNHNIMPVDERRLPKYTNIYINVIKKEFKAHNDEINCITILNEPLCFVTCSKDKFVKIWNLNCDCLGVISPFIKINKNDKKLPEWNFKINEEKILEDEINEVVGIFEKVGARKIIKGSKEDKEIEHIIVEDRNNNNKIERKEERKRSDRSYMSQTKEKKGDYFDEKNAYGEGYEKYYTQDKQNQIDGMINGENIPKIGINQLTIDAIKNMVETKEKKKK
jgi:WD40 repeat protein